MRIHCTCCGRKARIRKRRDVTPAFTIFYCMCDNVECAHSFTVEMHFGHTISPSALDLPDIMRLKLEACRSPQEVRQAFLPLSQLS